MTGRVLAEVRHFLNSLDPPDWPVTEAERDPLLEPGVGAGSAWHFTATGEALSQTDAKGHIRHFAHDRAGQLHDIRLQRAGQSTSETLVSCIEHNAYGQVLQELAGNGMRTFSSYDPANGQLLSLANQAPDGVFLQNLSYCYDPVGNITAITDAALPIQHFANQRIEPVRSFIYDTLYQLIEATGWESAKPSLGPELPEWQAFGPPDSSRWCNYSETYHYDEAANLLQRVHQGAVDDTLTMQVAAHSNRSIKERPGADLEALFDARGNLLELQPGQGLKWNGRNELAQVTQVARSDGTDDLECYVYDYEGMRLRKCRTAATKSNTHTADVRYLPDIELHTNSATGEQLQVVSVQAGRGSVRLLRWDSPPPNGVENDQLRYCLDDHLGSSAFEVDAQAKPISQEVYYPFGGTAWLAGRHAVETSYKTIRYSGKERDATGLYYYGARYYAPWLKRWLSADPAGDVDGLNAFWYSRNSPIVFVDQKGAFAILAYLQDLMIESAGDVTETIEQRGLSNIREHMPAAALALDQAFIELKAVLTYAVVALESHQLDPGIFEVYFGIKQASSEDLEYFSRGFRGMLLDVAHISSHPERLVAYSGGYAAAFVLSTDTARKVYVNGSLLVDRSIEKNARTLGHELTHLSPVFESKDFWYVPTRPNFPPEAVTSYHVIHDRSFSVEHLQPPDSNQFVSMTGAPSLEQAERIFKSDSALRTSMALHNADTLIHFARSLYDEIAKTP
jgi:insecticidal toxin complex protein TccC